MRDETARSALRVTSVLPSMVAEASGCSRQVRSVSYTKCVTALSTEDTLRMPLCWGHSADLLEVSEREERRALAEETHLDGLDLVTYGQWNQ